MSIPAYSTGSPGLSVLECNRQLHGPQLTRVCHSCQVNDSARNLQAQLCSAKFGVEAPTECNRTAAVVRFEDSERDRYNWRVRSLCGSLLLDQIGFVHDGGHAVCRAILFVEEGACLEALNKSCCRHSAEVYWPCTSRTSLCR